MEDNNKYHEEEDLTVNNPAADEEEELQFENPSVDPGFEPTYDSEDGGEATKDEKPVDDNASGNDALNYNNDRENGAYNPKNI